MNITLIDFTGKGNVNPARYAANILLFTKSTRLSLDQDLLTQVEGWPYEKVMRELEYMANTIPSSWEFVHYTFLLDGVSRAFCQQFERTRTASYAEKTLRIVDVSKGAGWDYVTGPTIENTGGDQLKNSIYSLAMDGIAETYKSLIEAGAAVEDARGILPLNIKTRLCASMNMRTFVELVRKRSGPRTQGEYRDVLEAMKKEAMKAHPWLTIFLSRTQDAVMKDLDVEIAAICDGEKRTRMMKLVDMLRTET